MRSAISRQIYKKTESLVNQIVSPMHMPKQILTILHEHILPFNWDVRKVWELKADIVEVPVLEFTYLLKLPLWSSVPAQGLLFDTCPLDVIRDPNVSTYQAKRLQETDTQHPIDVLVAGNKRWILDGVHRIAKHFTQNRPSLYARFHHESVIPNISLG